MNADGISLSGTGLIGTVLSGRYRLESKLGSGGMSTVYLALDETLQRRVAVKVMHREISDQPDQIERFRRESRAVAQLSHPNVVSVIDAGEDGGHPYIVFEYVDGETLKQRIDRFGRLSLDEAAAYAIEIGRGLMAAHQAQMVHRDVKPQNVLIDPEGRAKVTDFGIALSLESDGLTKTGRVLGTTDYVSPEQAMGGEVDARSDVYSLGILLYEMLHGDVPFKAETVVGVAMKHVNNEMPEIQRTRPGCSAALSAVIERATQKEPKNRYATMGAMLADLEGALEVEIARAGGASGEATTVLDSVPSKQRILSSRSVSIAGILLVLAGVLVALALVELGGESRIPVEEKGPGVAPPSGGEVALTDPSDFDPNGDAGESPDLVGSAIDDDPTGTAWVTEHYDFQDLASFKEGVGIYVATEELVTARTLEVTTVAGGWSADVYAFAGEPPDDLAGWGEPIGATEDAEEVQEIALNDVGDRDHYLLWITQLAPSTETEGRFRVDVSNLALFE